jgi:integrase
MSSRITDRLVRALPAPATGNRLYFDDELKGFAARVTAAGGRAFVLDYRMNGRQRRVTIGGYPEWSVAAARIEASRLKREIDLGHDPLEARVAARQAPAVADLAQRFDEEHLPGKRPRSADEDRALIRDYILPTLGKLQVCDVTPADIARMHRQITQAGKPYRANRTLACARTMFARSVEWGMRTDNPAKGGRGGISMNPEDHRQRFLSPAEIAHLAAVLDAHPERTTAALIRFLLLTGCRFGEAAGATWAQFDLTAGRWVKPSSHTKAKRQHTVPLSAPALALLTELKAESTGPLVFPSPKTGRPLTTIKTSWRGIIRKAELPNLRIHDLRHCFASVLANSGASLQLIGALLGHSNQLTTQRYAHLADDAMRAAAERVGALVAGTGDGADVVSLRRAR